MLRRRHRALAVLGATLIASAFVVPSAHAQSTDTTAVSITAGVLSVGTIAVADFTGLSVTGTQQTTTATMDSITVSDLRGGLGGGWTLTAQASSFSDGTNAFPAGSLEMLAPTIDAASLTTNVGTLPPTVELGPHTLDTTTASMLASADAGTLAPSGTGTWTFNNLADSLTLTVPADVIPGTYTSTVTMTVTAGPS